MGGAEEVAEDHVRVLFESVGVGVGVGVGDDDNAMEEEGEEEEEEDANAEGWDVFLFLAGAVQLFAIYSGAYSVAIASIRFV